MHPASSSQIFIGFPIKRQELYKPRYILVGKKCPNVTTQAHTFAVTTSKSHKIRGHRGGFNENVGDIEGFRVQMQGFPGIPWLDLRQGSFFYYPVTGFQDFAPAGWCWLSFMKRMMLLLNGMGYSDIMCKAPRSWR